MPWKNQKVGMDDNPEEWQSFEERERAKKALKESKEGSKSFLM